MCRITAELHDTTTLASDDGPPILRRRGTRPGSAFADITFGLLLRRILDFRHTLLPPDEDPPSPRFAWSGVRSFVPSALAASPRAERPCACLGDIVWADDLAACFVSPNAQAVAARSGTEAGYLSDASAQHGLKLSFGPSKTAVMRVIRGQGSREVRKHLFGGCAGGTVRSIPVLREHGPPDSVPLVRCYKHLGVVQNVDGSIKDELRQRIGHAWQAFRKARRKLFKCKQVSVEKRGVLLQSLVMSRLLIGAGSWPPLMDGEARMFQSCIISMYRQVLCIPHGADRHLHFCSTGLSSPDTNLHVERLRYALQVVPCRLCVTCGAVGVHTAG